MKVLLVDDHVLIRDALRGVLRKKLDRRPDRGQIAIGRRRVAMEQIAEWLKKLSMSEYTDPVVENRIDISVLAHLTDQHLTDFGMALRDR